MLLVALAARLAKVNAAWLTSRVDVLGKPCVAIDTPEGTLVWTVPGEARHLFEHRYYKVPPRKTVLLQSNDDRCELIESLVKKIDLMFEQSEKMKR